MDRSLSTPHDHHQHLHQHHLGAASDGDELPAARRGDGRPDIDQIRAFLESEYVPGADGCWTSTSPSTLHQRDSFIHRSYNKKLLARKNAIDEIPKPRPASMPVRRHTHHQQHQQPSPTSELPPPPSTTEPLTQPMTTHRGGVSEPVPLPATAASAAIKRDSFLRNSLNSIRRSFSIRSSKKSKANATNTTQASDPVAEQEYAMSENGGNDGNGRRKGRRKRGGKSAADVPSTDGAGANNNSYLHGDGYAMSDGGGGDFTFLNVPLENVRNYGHSRNSSTSSCTSQRSTNSAALDGSRPASMAPLLTHHQTTTGGSDSSHQQQQSLRSPSHPLSSVKIDPKSIKHLQPSPGSASSTPSPVARSPSPHPKANKAVKDVPEKKEKKRKELSSGRQKKFHRHFQQVAADEHVINYFSCALVSDILLQGHLYITDNYFAFYSNVFGFVTKLLIPTVSVVKISKEKTAKIIPNAVGVATADERHVFGSFMSREAAYRLMLSVWLPVAPVPDAETALSLPGGGSGADTASVQTSPSIRLPSRATPALAGGGSGSANVSGGAGSGVADQLEASEEFSVEDDSSSAISGNESPAVFGIVAPGVGGLADSAASTDATSFGVRHRNLVVGIDAVDSSSSSNPHHQQHNIHAHPPTQANSNGAKTPVGRSRSPAPQMVSLQRFYEIELPPRLMYVGYAVTALLLLLSAYLVWRIWTVSAVPAMQSTGAAAHVNWDVDQNIDVYAEVLKWQRQMQTKGADEAQIILNSNLEQIARVRKSLETLSILIHDKSAGSAADDAASAAVDGVVADATAAANSETAASSL